MTACTTRARSFSRASVAAARLRISSVRFSSRSASSDTFHCVRSRSTFTKATGAAAGSVTGVSSPTAQKREPSARMRHPSWPPRPLDWASAISSVTRAWGFVSSGKMRSRVWSSISCSDQPSSRTAPGFQLSTAPRLSSAMMAVSVALLMTVDNAAALSGMGCGFLYWHIRPRPHAQQISGALAGQESPLYILGRV
ncbi:hypothetical protein ASE31_28475 [Acidovorax sp. Root217]|nr:hypothetical protein ASE31_28475 [Acidovorax sp. Root217]